MTDYSKLSDFDINKAVAKKLNLAIAKYQPGKVSVQVQINKEPLFTFNPCKKSKDWAQLLVDNKINLTWLALARTWSAAAYDMDANWLDCENEKPGWPLRFVFL